MAPLVLAVTSLEDVTADMVIAALNEREVPVARVDPADIGPDLLFGARIDAQMPMWAGRLRTASREVELGEVAAVYYRRPTPYPARFGHLPAQQRDFAAAEARHGLGGILTSLHGARYVNHPAAVTRADFKPAQLKRFVELGLTIPPTLVTNDVEQAGSSPPTTGRSSTRHSAASPPRRTGTPGRSGPSASTLPPSMRRSR
ncbi:MvdC/MvdD family ATP grasp protein [Streptomyces sp. 8N616]|uniref:MvdC/MvdD family ATP grasp protein n=1 Tax=Streptomyces sp. 8N616 TaxID=3457414 RepID=UPI003FD4AB67